MMISELRFLEESNLTGNSTMTSNDDKIHWTMSAWVKDVANWSENDRGDSFTFGNDSVSKFLNRDLDTGDSRALAFLVPYHRDVARQYRDHSVKFEDADGADSVEVLLNRDLDTGKSRALAFLVPYHRAVARQDHDMDPRNVGTCRYINIILVCQEGLLITIYVLLGYLCVYVRCRERGIVLESCANITTYKKLVTLQH